MFYRIHVSLLKKTNTIVDYLFHQLIYERCTLSLYIYFFFFLLLNIDNDDIRCNKEVTDVFRSSRPVTIIIIRHYMNRRGKGAWHLLQTYCKLVVLIVYVYEIKRKKEKKNRMKINVIQIVFVTRTGRSTIKRTAPTTFFIHIELPGLVLIFEQLYVNRQFSKKTVLEFFFYFFQLLVVDEIFHLARRSSAAIT